MGKYGVPVYASRKGGGEEALAVEVEVAPPAVGGVEPHDVGSVLVQSNNLCWHGSEREQTYTYSYSQPTCNSYGSSSLEQSYGLHGVSDKPAWFPNCSFEEFHQAEKSQHEHCYEQALNVQVEPMEAVSSQKLEYYEAIFGPHGAFFNIS